MAQFDRLPPAERDYWVTEWQIKRETCPDCGNPLSECSDPERKWYPYRRVCYATMEREAAEVAYSTLHGADTDAQWHNGTFASWSKERSAAHPYSASSGMSIGVADRDLAPWDKFTTEVDASPIQPSDTDDD